ncbi:MAG: S8 family serine peptidase [Bacillota bacterium]
MGIRTKKLIGGLLILCLFLSTSLPAFAFTDLKEHWALEDIELLTAVGIIGGYPDNTFKADQGISRSELVRLLVSALNMDDQSWSLEGSSSLFRDVPLDHWARGYIQLAWELGIVTGYKDGSFRPEQMVTRAEMVVMLLRTLNYTGQQRFELDFKDELPEWAADDILLAAKMGLVEGFSDQTFRADEFVTRAQAVVFINRLLGERGSKYHLYGNVLEIKEQELVVELDGISKTLPLDSKAVFYGEQKIENLRRAVVRLPATAYLAFDQEGKIVFVKFFTLTMENPVSLSVNYKEQRDVAETGTKKLVYMEERLEDDFSLATSNPDPAASLEISKEAMGIPTLRRETGATGEGQVIAIIDSGADPGHPDLQWVQGGEDKILAWHNFTDEGKVALTGQISAGTNILRFENESYRLPALKSVSGVLRYGFLSEEEQKVDFNLNGKLEDRFLVVAADTEKAGVYDALVIDTLAKGDLTEEAIIKVFSKNKEHLTFTGPYQNRFNLIVSHFSPSGDQVWLGYDQLGHGTQVAGVAGANGKIQGVAPNAQLLIAKVLNEDGTAEWEQLAEGIRWAAAEGAGIINLSLGYYRDESSGNNTLTKLVDDLSEEGIIFTIAAGNEGPGIGTLATPGNAKSAISIGAYITPEMWKNDYGYEVKSPTPWYFSSAGPRQDGLMVPVIVAPGSAVSLWPLASGNGYRLGEGTSIAAPHVAGAVALLRQSSRNAGIELNAKNLLQALSNSGGTLPGISSAEIGYGTFDAGRTWRQLQRQQPIYPLRGYAYNRRLGYGEGLFSREIMPGDVPFYLVNQGQEDKLLFWNSSADWLKPLFKMTTIPAGKQRELPVEYVLPEEPGIYTGWLEGKFLISQTPDIRLMTTVIKPYLLHELNIYRQEFSRDLAAGQYERYFLKVPEGAEALQLSLAAGKASDGSYQGRVRFHVNKPDGSPYGMSDWTGLTPNGIKSQEWSNLIIERPEAGVWEVIVYSSASLSNYGREYSRYRLIAQAFGVDQQQDGKTRFPYLVSVVPKELLPGQPNYVTLHVRDKDNFKPITGIITINGQLYQVKKGQTTLIVVPTDGKYNLNVES